MLSECQTVDYGVKPYSYVTSRQNLKMIWSCESNMVSGTPNDSFSLGDGVVPSKESGNILDPEPLRRKGRPATKRKKGFIEKIGDKKKAKEVDEIADKKKEPKKKALSKKKAKEVDKITEGQVLGTQESVANLNCFPNFMGSQGMWPSMMPHTMQPNMAQGGTMLSFAPNMAQGGTAFNPFFNNFATSQTSMPSLLNNQIWRGQSSLAGNQVWGGQPNFLGSEGQGWGGRPQSFTEMMNGRDSSYENLG